MELHGRLQRSTAAAALSVEAVHGLGGVGKTELVLEFAHRYRSDYDIVWWIPAEEPTTAAGALVALAGQLGIVAEADQQAVINVLFAHLRQRERWLLIYDNAEQPYMLRGLLPPAGPGHVIATSRWPTWRQHADPLPVRVLSRAESVRLLAERAGLNESSSEQQGQLDRLAELVGDLPLALSEAGAYLEQNQRRLTEYLQLLQQRASELFGPTATALAEWSGPEADQRRMATVWSVSLQRIHRDSPTAEALLHLLAFLGADVPRTLLVGHPEALSGPLGEAAVDVLAFNQVLVAAGRYSLVDLHSESITMHRLVQTVIRAGLGAEEEATVARAAVELLTAAFPPDSWEVTTWTACEELLPHLLAVCDHAERLRVAGGQAGWLLERASNYLRERGQYRQALPLAQRALTLTETALPPADIEVGWRHDELGHVLRELGDLTGARTQLERALQISEAALGPGDPAIGGMRNSLGRVLHELGDLPGARIQLERALQISEAALGPDHLSIGIRRDSLGRVLHDLGDLAGARTQIERALQISETALGPDHPTTGIRRAALGSVLEDLGEPTGARTQLERALDISEAALGPDHPTIAIVRSNLGNVLWALGDHAAARAQYERALQISEAALGPDHPIIGTRHSNLGLLLADLGDLDGARDELGRALRISETALGPDHPTIGGRRSNLGNVLRRLGDLAGAQTQYERALQISEAALGPDHPQSNEIRMNSIGMKAEPKRRPD